MKRLSVSSGVLLLALSGIGYGIMASFVRVANSVVPPFTSVALRYALVSTVLVTVITVLSRWSQVRPLSFRDGSILIGVGLFGTGFSNVLFTLAVLSTTIGNAVFLMSLYTVFTPIMAGLFLKEWPLVSQWFALIVAVLGVGLLTGAFTTPQSGNPLGNTLALIGGFLLSTQYVGTRAVKTYPATTISLYLALGSIAASLPFVLIPSIQARVVASLPPEYASHSHYPTSLGWLALLAFATTNLVVNLLVSQGFRRVRASYGGVLLLLELPVSLLTALIAFGEWPNSAALVGCCLIFVAGAASVWAEGRRTDREGSLSEQAHPAGSIYADSP